MHIRKLVANLKLFLAFFVIYAGKDCLWTETLIKYNIFNLKVLD